ncbi:hypothetical protein [Fluviicola sp.]|uniref:hypothetical protein n=1 Tax=Fluviicola sp. TaxID=1917219 RepID=UPI0031D27414
MKKRIFSLSFAAILLVSCKKDYSCTCTDTYTYNGETEMETYSYPVKAATKKQARAACHDVEITYDETESEKTACELK